MAKRQKTALCFTPQAMYNQFKRPSAGIVSELYYIYRKTRLMILGLMSHVTIITWMAIYNIPTVKNDWEREREDGYLVPSPRYGFRFEAVSRLWDLNLTLSVYIPRKCNFRANFDVWPLIYCQDCRYFKQTIEMSKFTAVSSNYNAAGVVGWKGGGKEDTKLGIEWRSKLC